MKSVLEVFPEWVEDRFMGTKQANLNLTETRIALNLAAIRLAKLTKKR